MPAPSSSPSSPSSVAATVVQEKLRAAWAGVLTLGAKLKSWVASNKIWATIFLVVIVVAIVLSVSVILVATTSIFSVFFAQIGDITKSLLLTSFVFQEIRSINTPPAPAPSPTPLPPPTPSPSASPVANVLSKRPSQRRSRPLPQSSAVPSVSPSSPSTPTFALPAPSFLESALHPTTTLGRAILVAVPFLCAGLSVTGLFLTNRYGPVFVGLGRDAVKNMVGQRVAANGGDASTVTAPQFAEDINANYTGGTIVRNVLAVENALGELGETGKTNKFSLTNEGWNKVRSYLTSVDGSDVPLPNIVDKVHDIVLDDHNLNYSNATSGIELRSSVNSWFSDLRANAE